MTVTCKSTVYTQTKLLALTLEVDTWYYAHYRFTSLRYWQDALFSLKCYSIDQMMARRQALASLPDHMQTHVLKFVEKPIFFDIGSAFYLWDDRTLLANTMCKYLLSPISRYVSDVLDTEAEAYHDTAGDEFIHDDLLSIDLSLTGSVIESMLDGGGGNDNLKIDYDGTWDVEWPEYHRRLTADLDELVS